MPITYPITFPSRLVESITIRGMSVTAVSSSPFTGQQQVYKHPGQWWEAEVKMAPMLREDAEEVAAFLLKLNGMYGTFLLGDPAYTRARGVATGTPLVRNGGQTGDQLITDGWTPSVTGILKAGDWVQIGSGNAAKLHKVLDDANSDAIGIATLTLWPNLRVSPADNTPIEVQAPKGLWRLTTNDVGYSIETGKLYGITFACREAL